MIVTVPCKNEREEVLVIALMEYAHDTSLETMLGFVADLHASLAHQSRMPRAFDGDEIARAEQLNCAGRA